MPDKIIFVKNKPVYNIREIHKLLPNKGKSSGSIQTTNKYFSIADLLTFTRITNCFFFCNNHNVEFLFVETKMKMSLSLINKILCIFNRPHRCINVH